jgi:hypothetical protein
MGKIVATRNTFRILMKETLGQCVFGNWRIRCKNNIKTDFLLHGLGVSLCQPHL